MFVSILRHTLRNRLERRASMVRQVLQDNNTAERLGRQRDKPLVAADVHATDANRRERRCCMRSDDFGTQPDGNVIIWIS